MAVLVNDTWKFVSSSQPGVVHAAYPKRNGAAIVARCGVLVVPRTFDPGQLVHGCGKCIARGATPSRPLGGDAA